MQEVIPFMSLMKEVYFIFDIHIPNPEVFGKIFEDNQSCIAVAESNTILPRTKHIAIKYQHLQRCLPRENIRICYNDTQEQTSVIFTYPIK